MSRPNTRQSSTTKSSPRREINTNLIDLSGRDGVVRVKSRGSSSVQNRGRGTTPIGRRSFGTGNRALKTSPVSQPLESRQFARTEENFDNFAREILSKSLTVDNTEPSRINVSSTAITSQDNPTLTEEMATSGSNNEGGNQTLGDSNLDNLLAYLQQAMRSTQDEFRRELAAIRETIGTTATNRTDSATPASNIQLPGSQANSSYVSFNPGFKLKDWKISYNGEGSVSDFLFKLDTLVERSQCPHDHLMSNFHIFLTGKAETFYWDYIRQFQRATYQMLRAALSREFGSRESDHEILLKISTRKQLPKESYDDYHSFIVRWNLRLTNPLTDDALVEIIKKNAHADLKVMLFTVNPTDLGNLRDLARKAEKILLENRNASTSRQRQVNEIITENITSETPDEDLDLDPQVEAMKVNRTWIKGDYSKIECWNCSKLGHSYIYCPDETRHVFCYKCGQKGVTTVKCTGSHVGNRRRSEWATGDARSSK